MSAPVVVPQQSWMSVYAADYIWWYHLTGPLEVSLNGGEWQDCTQMEDPKGDIGWSAYFAGPLSDAEGLPLIQGKNILAVRKVGTPQPALVTTFKCE